MLRVTATLVLLCSCGDGVESDAGVDGATSDDGSTAICASDRDCGSQDLYCSRPRCRIGDPGADARGCIDLGAPCAAGQECDESADQCAVPAWCTDGRDGCSTAGDCDGDGADAVECGGPDCDDADANRFPDNAEVCDPEGHDEDCAPSLGDRDDDRDDFVDIECCNGEVCGDDCDDSRREVFPGATEQCNAIDDNCDGEVDEAGAFCPIGICRDTRCEALTWERIYQSDGQENTLSISVDPDGNAYILLYTDGADLDEDAAAEAPGHYVLALAADGRYRWHQPVEVPPVGGPGPIADRTSESLIVPQRSAAGTLQLVWLRMSDGATERTIDLPPRDDYDAWTWIGIHDLGGELLATISARAVASGNWVTFLTRLDTTMAVVGELMLETERPTRPGVIVDAGPGGVGIAGRLTADAALPSGTIPAGRFIARLTPGLDLVWTHALGSQVFAWGIAISEAGEMAAVGAWQLFAFDPPWDVEPWPDPMGSTGSFTVLFEPDGAHRWTRTHDGPTTDLGLSVGFDGRGYLVTTGHFSGRMDVPPLGARIAPDEDGTDGVFGVWSVPDGFPIRVDQIGGSGETDARDLAIDPFGGMVVCGTFTPDVVLPTGTPYSAPGGAFVFRVSDLDR